jgi:hypothetical protein
VGDLARAVVERANEAVAPTTRRTSLSKAPAAVLGSTRVALLAAGEATARSAGSRTPVTTAVVVVVEGAVPAGGTVVGGLADGWLSPLGNFTGCIGLL